MARDAELQRLKESRSAAKRKCTRTFNLLQTCLDEDPDCLDSAQKLHERLQNEFREFENAFDAYERALESLEDRDDHEDYQRLGTYLREVSKKLFTAEKLLKVRREDLVESRKAQEALEDLVESRKALEDNLNVYKWQRSEVMEIVEAYEDKDDADLSEDGSVRVSVAVLEPEIATLKTQFNKLMLESVKDMRAACEAAKANYDEEKIKVGLDASHEDITRATGVLRRLRIAADAQTKKENAEAAKMDHNSELERINAQAKNSPSPSVSKPTPIKLDKVENLKFDGEYRSWASFINEFKLIVMPEREPTDIGLRLKQAMPKKYSHLLANIPTHNYERMLEVLEDKFGNQRHIIASCRAEIERFKKPSTDEAFMTLVDKLEKILMDCKAVNLESLLDHPTMIEKIEEKLPDLIKLKWLEYCEDNGILNGKNAAGLFPRLIKFMLSRKNIADYIVGDPSSSASSSKAKFCTVTAVTSEPASASALKVSVEERGNTENKNKPCWACYKEGAEITEKVCHKFVTCPHWKKLSLEAKKKLVMCTRCPFKRDHKTEECPHKDKKWFKGVCHQCSKKNDHHYLFCSQTQNKSACNKVSVKDDSSPNTSFCSKSLVKTLIVKTGRSEDEEINIMEDNCSTDSFVRIDKTTEMELVGEPVVLELEGINETRQIETHLYLVPVQDKFGNIHSVSCYGLPEIAKEADLPDQGEYRELCRKFEVDPSEVRKPQQIDLLLSSRHNHLMSDEVVNSKDGVKLYSGPLGKAFMGDIESVTSKSCSYPTRVIPVHPASVKRARTIKAPLSNREILEYFKEESIGAECSPKCGSCACGKCPTGAQQLSIKEEKAYKRFRDNMFLDKTGTPEDPGPYWRTNYPWLVPRHDLVDNYGAVLGVMNSTHKKLERNPEWRAVYEKQLRDLIDNGFAQEVSNDELENWVKVGNKRYFISHQMVIDEGNKTSPVRCVFNSSQMYRGYSLNNCWELGPDMTGSLNGILIRFREGIVAAQGDIRKMYYAVRVKREEQMMQLWLWRFSGEDKIRVFAMTRLVMGNKPSANVSQIALKETAHLDDNEKKFPAAKTALCSNSYVDNVFTMADNHEVVHSNIEEVETVAGQAGFIFKPWIISGTKAENVKLGGPPSDNVEKALGLFWEVENDRLFVKVQIDGKKRKLVLSLNSYIENPELKLTVRDCLSLHARCYDPIGLILPLKMTGMLLFRKTLQFLSAKNKAAGESKKLPWDQEVEGEIRVKWMEYFRMLEGVKDITFPRSVKPINTDPNIRPVIITFSDGNKDSFGSVLYLLWTLIGGEREARLVTSKAKLAPLLNQGEVVKNELAGATFAVRIKSWLIENSSLDLGDFQPFVDSQIVQAMVKREDYELNTYAGLRVKEIAKKSDPTAWLHISSKDNFVSDILTKGTSPDNLREGSDWQTGPKWLIKDQDTWPVTQVTLTKEERDTLKGFEKVSKVFKSKTVSHSVSSSSGPECQGTAAEVRELHLGPDFGADPDNIKEAENVPDDEFWIDTIVNRVSSLKKIVRITAHFLRLVGRNPLNLEDKADTVIRTGPISAAEFDDALKMIILHEQKGLKMKSFQGFDIEDKVFTLNTGEVIMLKVLRCRVKSFPKKFSDVQDDVFPLPPGVLAKRIAVHYHERLHRDVDTVVAAIRQEYWVPRLRKIVSAVDRNCRSCLISRRKVACQVMGNLPDFRTTPTSAFSQVSMDLFGPILVKDSVVRRGPNVRKKCWGVLFACLGSRAIYVDIAENYSTEAVLHTIRRLQAEKGQVRLIISDPGTQLKGAARELREVREGWSKEELVRFGAETGLEWNFTMPASAHQNGVTEILVKMAKGVMHSMMDALGTHVLNLNELFTVMKEVSSLVNERPIGIKPNTQVDPAYLSPNSLLLGRSCDRTNAGPFQNKIEFDQDPNSDRTRYLLVQAITNQFWRKWTTTFFPTLLRRAKWHHTQRNLCVDDVCLLRDQNAMRGEWRMCRVKDVMPDEQMKVRNVVVTVPPPSLALYKGDEYPKNMVMNELQRHVSNLIVIAPASDEIEALAGSVKL